uniref:Uncharacterized protein n=1 Tax=Magallana gigas TaxID=29159 RepID=A0A8W8IJG0_MAGGI
MAIKCTVYDLEKLRNMEVGSTIMFMNIIVKPNNSITITSKSRVCKTGPVSVSAEHDRTALELAVPPTSPGSPLIDVEKSHVKTMMSTRGQVVAEEMTRKVLVRGRDVKIKALVLKDKSAK